jgi:hypothetical protein
MKKGFAEYLESQPQMERNWDHTARRPPATAPQPENPKAKTKKKEKQTGGSDIEFDDNIKFETPPITPLPPPPEQIKAQSVQRDDKFWDFYDEKTT